MDISSSVIEPVALENPRDEHREKQDDPYKAFDFVHFLPFTYLVPRGMIDMQGPEKFCFVQPTHGEIQCLNLKFLKTTNRSTKSRLRAVTATSYVALALPHQTMPTASMPSIALTAKNNS
jgi:hypothetical protein